MSSDVISRLELTYLVGGMPNLDGSLAEGSLRLLPDLMFAMETHREPAIVGTDDHGLLRTYDSQFQASKPVQLPPRAPLVLAPIPQDVIRQAVLVFGKQWQDELRAHLAFRGGRTLRTLPVKFSAKNLRAPSKDDDAAIKVYNDLASEGPLSGQLVPQPRVLIVLFDESVLSNAPNTVHAKIDGQVAILHCLRERVALKVGSGRDAFFYAYCSAQPGLREGRYTVHMPADSLRARFRAGPGSRTFEVAFGVNTLSGEFDFHVFEFPSAESVILTHFADQFAHILGTAEDGRDPGGAPAPVFAAADSQTLRARVPRVLGEIKPKLVVGYAQVNALGGLPDLFAASLASVVNDHPIDTTGRQRARAAAKAAGTLAATSGGMLRSTARQMLGEDAEKGWKGAVGMALEAWAVHDQAKEILESWKKFQVARKNAHGLGLVRDAVDAKGIEKFFLRNKWRTRAIELLAEHEEGARNQLGYFLHWQKQGPDADLIKRAMNKALPAPLKELQSTVQKSLNVAGQVWNLTPSVRSLAQAAASWTTAEVDEKAARSRLLTDLDDYDRRYRGHPCLQAIPQLEATRRLADLSADASEKARKEALQAALTVARDVLRCLPITQEAMMVVDVAEAVYEIGHAGIEALGDRIDQYLWRYKSGRERLGELYKAHAEQVRSLRRKGKIVDDPEARFRVRVMVVIGLLALVERCGRRRDDGKFAGKVGQYQIDKYIEQYLSKPGPVALPLAAGCPLDELWLYAHGHKSASLEDLTLTAFNGEWPSLDELGELKYASADFHPSFPCYGMDSPSAEAFARAFSRNFADVVDKDLAFFAVYVRRKPGEPWIVPSAANWKIGPFTPARAVAVFKSQSDLSGTPVSLQLKRFDEAVDGPVYKSMLVRAFASSGAGDDKGLLPSVANERKFIGEAHAYTCVFFPFYYYKSDYIDGLKPFGHVAVSDHREMKIRFSLKVGDDESKVLHVEPGTDELTVHLPSGKVYDEMASDNDFLAHKASNAYTKRLFVDGRVWVAGAFVRRETDSYWIPAPVLGEAVPLRAGGEFRFAWGSACDLVIILFGEGAGVMNYSEDPIRFPAKASLRIAHWYGDAQGPEYDVTFASLDKQHRLTSTTTGQMETMLGAVKLDVLACQNPSSVVFQGKDFGSLFAAHFSSSFDVEGEGGGVINKRGLKPFGGEFHQDDEYNPTVQGRPLPYEYRMSIRGPEGLGLTLDEALTFSLPGIPSSLMAGTPFSGPEVVTDKRYWKSIQLLKLRY